MKEATVSKKQNWEQDLRLLSLSCVDGKETQAGKWVGK